MDNPYGWLRELIEQVPEFVQPLIVAVAGAIPYVEGEGASALGILVGINPIVAAVAGAAGNILCVLGVVYLGAGIRERVLARKKRTPALVGANGTTPALADTAPAPADTGEPADATPAKPTRQSKGRERLRRWLVRFGVPGASLLAPLALPTMLTAAYFAGSGVPKRWVILWQVIAIVLWTSLVAAAASGLLALLGW